MKQSKKPNIRINRAVKQMTQEGNGYPEKNYIIHPNLFKTTVKIIETHLNLN